MCGWSPTAPTEAPWPACPVPAPEEENSRRSAIVRRPFREPCKDSTTPDMAPFCCSGCQGLCPGSLRWCVGAGRRQRRSSGGARFRDAGSVRSVRSDGIVRAVSGTARPIEAMSMNARPHSPPGAYHRSAVNHNLAVPFADLVAARAADWQARCARHPATHLRPIPSPPCERARPHWNGTSYRCRERSATNSASAAG
jgi:hypothetical protein